MFNLIKRILPFWGKVPKYRGNYKKETVYAFTCKGVDYFTFADIFQTPYQRMLLAGFFQDEATNGYNSELINNYIDNTIQQFDSNTIDLKKVYNELKLLKAKINTRFDLEALLNVGSCMFITNDEDAYGYSVIYNKAKIRDWKESNVDSFFLIIRLVIQAMHSTIHKKDLALHLTQGLAGEIEYQERSGVKKSSNFLSRLKKGSIDFKKAILEGLQSGKLAI